MQEKWTKIITDLDPRESMINLLKKWEDGFIKVAGPQLINIAKDRQDYWKSLEKTFIDKQAAHELQDTVPNAM